MLNNGTTGQGFTTQDQQLLTTFGAQAAIAIKNARLFAEVRQQTARLGQTNAKLHHETGERQRAEAALRQARDELEMRVEERTAALRLAKHVSPIQPTRLPWDTLCDRRVLIVGDHATACTILHQQLVGRGMHSIIKPV